MQAWVNFWVIRVVKMSKENIENLVDSNFMFA